MNAEKAYKLAVKLFRATSERSIGLEDIISTSAYWAYQYAYYVLNKRWADIGKPEVEDLLKTRKYWSFYKEYFNI